MANPDIGILIALEGVAQYNRRLKEIEGKSEKTFGRVGKSVDGIDSSFQGLAKSVPGVGSALNLMANPLVAITAGLTAAGAAALSFIDDAARFEEVQIQFETLIGDAGRAEDALNELASFAATTPFQFEDLAQAGRNLLAFGTSAEELTPTLRRLGDISAGIGAPLTEISEIYGKIQVQGRVFGEDINQLLGRGIPIVGELAKQFGVAEEEVKALVSQGRVGFPQIEQAFISLTSAGGRFAGLTQSLSESYSGQLSTFRDNIDAVSRTMGQALLPAATSVLRVINDLIGGTSRYSDELENERIELNVLVQRIGRYNEGNEDRAQLIQELNQKYPGFLGNLNTETVTNEELANRLREVNQQYINKIIIQKEEEAIAEQVNELSEAQSKILKKEIEITRDLVEIRDKYNLAIEDGLSLQDQLNQTIRALQELDRTAQFGQRQTNTIGFLRGQWATYTNAVQDAQEAEQQLSGLQQQRDEIAKRLGVTTEDLVESTENVAGATQKAAENLLDFAILPTTPIKVLKEQLDKVNEAIENIDPTSVEFKALSDQADAIERRISQIEGKVTIDTGDATEKVQTLAEKLDELGISLNALNQFDELTGLANAIPLASITDSAERAKAEIISIALEPGTPLSQLEEQLSNIKKALELIDPQSAGFEFLAEQAGILEARVNRLNAELDRLSDGGPRQPIVFPVELSEDNILNQVETLDPPPITVPVDVVVPNQGAFASLAEAAQALGVDIEYLNNNFRNTGELIELMDSKAFNFFEQFTRDTETAIEYTFLLREALTAIAENTLQGLGSSVEAFGFALGQAIANPIETVDVMQAKLDAVKRALETAPEGSGLQASLQQQAEALEQQLGGVQALRDELSAVNAAMRNLPSDSPAFRALEGQAESLENQLSLLEGTTSRFAGAFDTFVQELLNTILVAVPKMLGLFLLQGAVVASWPAGIPFAVAGLALLGLSALAKGLLEKAAAQDPPLDLGTFDPGSVSSNLTGGFSGPSLATGQADTQTAVGLSDYANTAQAATNITIQFDSEDVTEQFSIFFQRERELTGG